MPDDVNALIRRGAGRAVEQSRDAEAWAWWIGQLAAGTETPEQRKAWDKGATPEELRAMPPRGGGARDAGAGQDEPPRRQSMNDAIRGVVRNMRLGR
jgi:hypothetical protein